MEWTSHQNTVLGPTGITVSFEFVVRKVLTVGNVAVVLLDVPRDRSMPENVFGLAGDGTRLWQIEAVQTHGGQPYFHYVDMDSCGADRVRLWNYGTFVVDLDVNTGRVLRTEGMRW
jgi:hypothetical protein